MVAFATLLLAACVASRPSTPKGDPAHYSVEFYNVSDPHVVVPTDKNSWRLSKDASALFAEVLSLCDAAKPDLILVSGDVAEGKLEGRANTKLAYELLARLSTPWLVVPGNHDGRYTKKEKTVDGYSKAEFYRIFQGHGPDGSSGYWRYDIPGKKLTFIGIDTSIESASEGMVGESQLSWLDKTLSELPPDRRAFIITHHPLIVFNPVILHQDKPVLSIFVAKDAAQARSVLERYRWKILAVLSGHTHSPEYASHKGIAYIGTPSINTWPNRYTKFTVDHDGLKWQHLEIPRQGLVAEAWVQLSHESPFLDALKSTEALRGYFLHGPLEGRIDFEQ